MLLLPCTAHYRLAAAPPVSSTRPAVASFFAPYLQLEDWEAFDVFRLAQLTDGRPLQTVALSLLRRRGLLARLCLPEERLRKWVLELLHLGVFYCCRLVVDALRRSKWRCAVGSSWRVHRNASANSTAAAHRCRWLACL